MVEEKELVSALQSEHQKDAAVRSLLSQYKERLYWHIRKIVLNHDDTDDVLQNTFIKIFNNIVIVSYTHGCTALRPMKR